MINKQTTYTNINIPYNKDSLQLLISFMTTERNFSRKKRSMINIMPTLAIFQLYRGVNKFYYNLDPDAGKKTISYTFK